MKVAIFGLKATPEILDLIERFLIELESRNVKYTIYRPFYSEFPFMNSSENIETFSNKSDICEQVELIFTFGGDGTILSVVPIIQDLSIAIIGINTGRLGFLTTISKEDIISKIDDFLLKKYTISKRNLLKLECDFPLEYPYALNEIAIVRKETTSMITIESFVNDEYLNTFWADGLIISTPTGSTGYNLSCGGPILFPENETIILTPIAPHNLNVRPFSLPNSVEFKFKTYSRVNEFSVTLDSRMISLPSETEIKIKIAPFRINIATHKDYSYYKTLRNKLLWGNDSRN